MSIVLYGGGGFVGTALGRALRARGHVVHVILRPEGSPDLLPRELDGILRDCTHLFHLASATTPGLSRREPSREVRDNLLPTATLLETLLRHPTVQTIFMSSGGAIYGNCVDDLVAPGLPPAPISNYGAGKAAIEAFLHAHQAMTGSTVTLLRPSNLYGPGQTRRGDFGVVPTLLHCARTGHPFDLWGDGETTRDFLYIDDFVALCLALVERAPSVACVETFNAGSGLGCSIKDLVALIGRVTGRPIQTRHLEARGIDVRRIVLDTRSVRDALAWQPQVGLAEGLARTWQWFSDQDAAGNHLS